jgi:hypothetical protein
MLLEVSSELVDACEPTLVAATFLCEASVHSTVSIAVAHVAQLWHMRVRLAAALAACSNTTASAASEAAAAFDVGSKRGRSDVAVADAQALLSPLGVSRKIVLTLENLEQAINAIDGEAGHNDSLPSAAAVGAFGLFFAGRWLDASRPLSEYVGRNEKSKVKMRFGNPRQGDEKQWQRSNDASSSAAAAAAEEEEEATPSPVSAATNGGPPPAATAAPTQGGGSLATDAPSEACAVQDNTPAATGSSVSLSTFFQTRSGDKSAARGHESNQLEGDSVPDEDEDLSTLSAAQAEALCASASIRAALRDPRLQEVLRHVDSAPTREGALHRLERALGDPEFEVFALAALRQIGHEPGA